MTMSEADGEAGPSSPRAAKGQHRGSISQSIGSPSRSVSPSGDKGRQQLPNIQTGSERRRDHVSVGNRVSRIVVTRPPYAARDDLDFERRARSSTVGSNTGSAHNDRSHKGRHPGIQPSAYASPTRGGVPGDGQSSQLSSSTATAVEDGAANNEKHNAESTEANGEKGKQKEKTEQDNLNQPGSQPSNQAINPRPSVERMASNDPSRWMAFTLPTRYKKRFDEYMAQRAKEEERREREEAANADESSNSDDSDRNDAGDYFSTRRHTRRSNKRRRTGDFINDAEEGRSGSGQRRKPKTTSRRTSRGEDREGSGSSRRQHGHGADVISANQAQTPGWASPWNPGTAGTHRQNSFGALAMEGLGISHFGQEQKKKSTRLGRFQKWLVRSAFAPLFLRIANLAFTISELAVAIHIRQLTLQNNVYGILGSSTIFGVVVGPLSIVHIFVNVYVEYFGSPIGVWKVRSKMYYTLVELLFICLWSALLSLAFDDVFTSTAGCTAYTPNSRYNNVAIGASSAEGSLATQLCGSQVALIALVFVGLILYVMVLIVSLFRIFAKISRYSSA